MDFRIADTFTGSLARLTGDEKKNVKTTAFDLQLNPANPGMSFHKLAKAKDKNFYNTERHLLYVACTRARDHLLVTSVEPASEFLDDLQLR